MERGTWSVKRGTNANYHFFRCSQDVFWRDPCFSIWRWLGCPWRCRRPVLPPLAAAYIVFCSTRLDASFSSPSCATGGQFSPWHDFFLLIRPFICSCHDASQENLANQKSQHTERNPRKREGILASGNPNIRESQQTEILANWNPR